MWLGRRRLGIVESQWKEKGALSVPLPRSQHVNLNTRIRMDFLLHIALVPM